MEKEKITSRKLRNFQSYMNVKALGNAAYIPTEVEHIANVLSHGFCVIPALAGLLHMLRLPGELNTVSYSWLDYVKPFVFTMRHIILHFQTYGQV